MAEKKGGEHVNPDGKDINRPWDDVSGWLVKMNLGQYVDLFKAHCVTADDIPFLKESHLKEMGISSVGDRLRILDCTRVFLRGVKNANRQKVITKFKNWEPCFCFQVFAPEFQISESAIEVRNPKPLFCRVDIDNVDVTSITDVRITELAGLLAYVTVQNNDRSYGGPIKIRLSLYKGREIFGMIKRIWESDQLRMGRKGKDD